MFYGIAAVSPERACGEVRKSGLTASASFGPRRALFEEVIAPSASCCSAGATSDSSDSVSATIPGKKNGDPKNTRPMNSASKLNDGPPRNGATLNRGRNGGPKPNASPFTSSGGGAKRNAQKLLSNKNALGPKKNALKPRRGDPKPLQKNVLSKKAVPNPHCRMKDVQSRRTLPNALPRAAKVSWTEGAGLPGPQLRAAPPLFRYGRDGMLGRYVHARAWGRNLNIHLAGRRNRSQWLDSRRCYSSRP